MNATQTRNNTYKKYIIELLNLNNTDYINILLDSFKNEVDILLKNIIKKIQGNSYLEALIINGNLNEAINEIYENILIQIQRIKLYLNMIIKVYLKKW